MKVPVPGMRDVGDRDLVALGDLFDALQHLGDPGDGHAHVLGEHRAKPLDRRVRQPPRREEPRALGRIARPRSMGCPALLEDRKHPVGGRAVYGLRIVELGEEDYVSVGGDAQVLPGVHRAQAVPVDELQRSRDEAGLGRTLDRRPGGALSRCLL
jgi:hypothetical protein